MSDDPDELDRQAKALSEGGYREAAAAMRRRAEELRYGLWLDAYPATPPDRRKP